MKLSFFLSACSYYSQLLSNQEVVPISHDLRTHHTATPNNVFNVPRKVHFYGRSMCGV